eukprot:907673_1
MHALKKKYAPRFHANTFARKYIRRYDVYFDELIESKSKQMTNAGTNAPYPTAQALYEANPNASHSKQHSMHNDPMIVVSTAKTTQIHQILTPHIHNVFVMSETNPNACYPMPHRDRSPRQQRRSKSKRAQESNSQYHLSLWIK